MPRIRFGIVDLGSYETQDSWISIGVESLPLSNHFLISPNPSTGRLSFNLPDFGIDGQMLTVISEKGAIVYQTLINQTKGISLDLGWLDTGIYFIRVSGEKETYIGKWMKL